jgi:hypothetical protein
VELNGGRRGEMVATKKKKRGDPLSVRWSVAARHSIQSSKVTKKLKTATGNGITTLHKLVIGKAIEQSGRQSGEHDSVNVTKSKGTRGGASAIRR